MSSVMPTMRTSALIIAHNEERYIARCIESLLRQTVRPSEIVLVAHNSTDRTKEIAEDFPITVVPLNGTPGIVHARLEGFAHVSGDIILCIDGDSYARRNWVDVMTRTLAQGNTVLAGSWVKFKGTIFGNLYNIYNRCLCVSKNQKVAYWIWGTSYAFWGKDKERVAEILKKSAALSDALKLPRNPEDYWLALFMSTYGNLAVTNETWVTSHTKETSTLGMFFRRKESYNNRRLMDEHFARIVLKG